MTVLTCHLTEAAHQQGVCEYELSSRNRNLGAVVPNFHVRLNGLD